MSDITQSPNPHGGHKIFKYRASCDACTKSKIRCSQTRPSCTRCLRQSAKCVYGLSRRTHRSAPRAEGSGTWGPETSGFTTDRRRYDPTPHEVANSPYTPHPPEDDRVVRSPWRIENTSIPYAEPQNGIVDSAVAITGTPTRPPPDQVLVSPLLPSTPDLDFSALAPSSTTEPNLDAIPGGGGIDFGFRPSPVGNDVSMTAEGSPYELLFEPMGASSAVVPHQVFPPPPTPDVDIAASCGCASVVVENLGLMMKTMTSPIPRRDSQQKHITPGEEEVLSRVRRAIAVSEACIRCGCAANDGMVIAVVSILVARILQCLEAQLMGAQQEGHLMGPFLPPPPSSSSSSPLPSPSISTDSSQHRYHGAAPDADGLPDYHRAPRASASQGRSCNMEGAEGEEIRQQLWVLQFRKLQRTLGLLRASVDQQLGGQGYRHAPRVMACLFAHVWLAREADALATRCRERGIV